LYSEANRVEAKLQVFLCNYCATNATTIMDGLLPDIGAKCIKEWRESQQQRRDAQNR
jgi:hypothetical protein